MSASSPLAAARELRGLIESESEAIEEKNKILGATQKELDKIEGDREQRSVEIRGQADADVIKLTAEAYGQSPEFYEFLRRLEVLKKTIGSDSRLILTTESDIFKLLKEPTEFVDPAIPGPAIPGPAE